MQLAGSAVPTRQLQSLVRFAIFIRLVDLGADLLRFLLVPTCETPCPEVSPKSSFTKKFQLLIRNSFNGILLSQFFATVLPSGHQHKASAVRKFRHFPPENFGEAMRWPRPGATSLMWPMTKPSSLAGFWVNQPTTNQPNQPNNQQPTTNQT